MERKQIALGEIKWMGGLVAEEKEIKKCSPFFPLDRVFSWERRMLHLEHKDIIYELGGM